jgi:hypothetical protein
MFGRGWEPGQATIVALKEIRSIGTDDYTGRKFKSCEYVADVQPDGGGAVFRTVMHEPFDERVWRQPSVGDVVPVTCDPRRQKAKFDTATVTARDKARKEATKREQAAQFDVMVNALPGSTASSPVTDVQSPLADISATVSRLSGATGEISETMAAIQRARASGNLAEVERLKAEFQNRAHQNAAAARQAAAGLAPQAAASDPLERLQKLADLHDRGVLTDAEFAAEKAKILGQQ